MTRYAALLRAVNVGGTGKLAMTELAAMCAEVGFAQIKTYIASGNVVFSSELGEDQVKARLEDRLAAYAGKPVSVFVRTCKQIEQVRDANPFPDSPGNRVVAIFLDEAPPADALEKAVGQAPDEETALGEREVYVRYGAGMADTKLRIPAAQMGTARNMNTVAKLAEMCRGPHAGEPLA